MASLPISTHTLSTLRDRLNALTTAGAARRTGMEVLRTLPRELSITPLEVTAVLEIGAAVARAGTDEDLTVFLRSGRLPDLIQLTPRQMDRVRGGCFELTAVRGIAPLAVVENWLHVLHSGNRK